MEKIEQTKEKFEKTGLLNNFLKFCHKQHVFFSKLNEQKTSFDLINEYELVDKFLEQIGASL